jgi:hypothetical protein
MALTPQQMDEKMHEHFAFEARDNIEGVLATLTEDVEHDIVGWPFGPSHGRDGARKFYEATFHDLSESKVRCVKRLYGHNFMVDESIWTGRAPGTPFGLEGRNHPPGIPTAARRGIFRQRRHQTRKRVAGSRLHYSTIAAGLT